MYLMVKGVFLGKAPDPFIIDELTVINLSDQLKVHVISSYCFFCPDNHYSLSHSIHVLNKLHTTHSAGTIRL